MAMFNWLMSISNNTDEDLIISTSGHLDYTEVNNNIDHIYAGIQRSVERIISVRSAGVD